jgi:hypothetical protein
VIAVSLSPWTMRLVPAGADLVGLGATAALVSDRPRKGEHRFHIAFANSAGIAHCTCVMAKGRRDRAAEEDLVSRAIVLWLARACGIAAPSPRSLLDADENYAETVVATVDTIDQLLAGEFDRVTVQPDGFGAMFGRIVLSQRSAISRDLTRFGLGAAPRQGVRSVRVRPSRTGCAWLNSACTRI